jgi:hypothetical protein
MPISDELLDYLGNIYQKYPFKMTFIEFLEKVIARKEKQSVNPDHSFRPIQLISNTSNNNLAVWSLKNYHHSYKYRQPSLLIQH